MKQTKGWLTSGAFAALCGTTKETLRHYKDIGLLPPAHQGENGYFDYDLAQFYDFYAISIFRQTGTSQEEIRRSLPAQDAAGLLALLRGQQQRLEEERRQLEQMEMVLSGMIRNLELGASPDLVPRTAWFEAEHLLALPAEELAALLPPGAEEDAVLSGVLEHFRDLCRRYGLQTDHQLGAIHRPGETAGQGTITHLYTRIKEPSDLPWGMEKPAGIYLYLCCRGRWDLSAGYDALCRQIQSQGLRTEGPVYACDLAGFILNGVEKNAMSLLSVRLAGPAGQA